MDVFRAHHHYPPLVYQDAEGREAILAAQAYFEEYERAMMDQEDWPGVEDGYLNGEGDSESVYYYDDSIGTGYQDAEDAMSSVASMAEDSEHTATYDYHSDSLLRLIIDVQSYLMDTSQVEAKRTDRPLLELQYKMYTYLKQRACDIGFDVNALA